LAGTSGRAVAAVNGSGGLVLHAYPRFADIAEAVRRLKEVPETGEWQREEFFDRAAVT
tara:strand:- start:783 stop:956 length:174 start_codon:yes stop_codon:yes gene_type:complete